MGMFALSFAEPAQPKRDSKTIVIVGAYLKADRRTAYFSGGAQAEGLWTDKGTLNCKLHSAWDGLTLH